MLVHGPPAKTKNALNNVTRSCDDNRFTLMLHRPSPRLNTGTVVTMCHAHIFVKAKGAGWGLLPVSRLWRAKGASRCAATLR